MVRVLTVLLMVMVAGCATNKQKFVDVAYSLDEVWEIHEGVAHMVSRTQVDRTIKGRNLTNAPPFGGSAVADAHLNMTDDENWTVMMGQISDLYGGDMTEIVNSLVEAGVLTATGGASALTRLGE